MANNKELHPQYPHSAAHDDSAPTLPTTADPSALLAASWELDPSEQIIAALRSYFLTHTLDFLTGEVYTVH